MDGSTEFKALWPSLSEVAWTCRERAYLLGKTKVGAAALSDDGQIAGGCNLEHPWRISVHAEVNAISTMVAGGHRELRAILIAAERELFTPCGACLDWIFEMGGPDCLVAHQASPGGHIRIWRARELMPYYPK